MRRAVATVTVFVLASGLLYGQEKQPPNPKLECYRPFLGTWRYEGVLHEDVPGMGQKGTTIVFTISWRWILNRTAVEENFRVEFKEGATYAEKTLIGWNAAEQKIVYGGIASEGTMYLGSITPDGPALKAESRGTTGKGKEVSYRGVVTKTGSDTITWQALERSGGLVEGPSPPYELKRVEQAKQAK